MADPVPSRLLRTMRLAIEDAGVDARRHRRGLRLRQRHELWTTSKRRRLRKCPCSARRSSPVVTSIKGRSASADRAGQRVVRRGVPLRRGGQVPPIAGLAPTVERRSRAASGARGDATARRRLPSSTASPVAVHYSASSLHVAGGPTAWCGMIAALLSSCGAQVPYHVLSESLSLAARGGGHGRIARHRPGDRPGARRVRAPPLLSRFANVKSRPGRCRRRSKRHGAAARLPPAATCATRRRSTHSSSKRRRRSGRWTFW